MRPKEVSEPPKWETIEELFAALESPLLGYALRLTGDRGVAEDMVQDAFMKLHAQFEQVMDPKRWLYRTVHNRCLNHRRAAGRIVPLNPPGNGNGDGDGDGAGQREPADTQALPDEELLRLEGIGLVRLSIESLDERGRELIRLKFTDGLSYKEISARTGLSVGNVGYLLHHALKAVAGELAKNGVVS